MCPRLHGENTKYNSKCAHNMSQPSSPVIAATTTTSFNNTTTTASAAPSAAGEAAPLANATPATSASRKRRRKSQNPQAYLPDSTITTTTNTAASAIGTIKSDNASVTTTIASIAIRRTENFDAYDSSQMSGCSDVETFQGQIVYNLDGSAFIINESKESTVSVGTDSNCLNAIAVTPFSSNLISPQITGSTTTTTTTTKYRTTAISNLPTTKAKATAAEAASHLTNFAHTATTAANPRIHSFRVVTAHDASNNCNNSPHTLKLQKPILMCFICKLSFSNTKSFITHAASEHKLNLQELEEQLLSREYSSAIIQRNMDEKPQISFLEPLDVHVMAQDVAAAAAAECKSTEFKSLTNAQQVATTTTISAVTTTTTTAKTAETTSSNAAAQSTTTGEKALENVADCGSSTSCSNNTTLSMSHAADKLAPTAACLNLISLAATATTKTNENINTINCCTTTIITTTLPTASCVSHMTAATAAAKNRATESGVEEEEAETFDANSTDNLSSHKLCSPSSNSNRDATNNTSHINTTGNSITASSTCGIAANASAIIAASASTTGNSRCSSASSIDCRQSPALASPTFAPETTDAVDFSQQQHRLATSPNNNSNNSMLDASLLQKLQQHHAAATFPTPQQHMPFALATAAAANSPHQLSSLQASLSALTNEQNSSNSVKLISEFLQHQLGVKQQQQQQHFALVTCPEHPDYKGIDCKPCELLEVQLLQQQDQQQQQLTASAAAHLKSPLTLQRSPNSNSNATAGMLPTNLSISPTSMVVANATAASSNVSGSGAASSFTIGACSEHINGRPLGVDCARCEMILNSARLNSSVQMSTRNSCKTLKCPQCNWHYKYQETLEIHMREKHPDGESACGYCLAGQQHPRLARGESYSCGYKPYRCEICNYSTTTKGNLSIHMQSDKHLNNMQELNSSQNMVAAAAAAAVGKLETATKMLVAPASSVAAVAAAASQQQQSAAAMSSAAGSSSTVNAAASSTIAAASANKPKPSFRCDICSYETSVARNLRIHMTSEKHTHNMVVLQNNIKHIQAFSFLQQQHQQAAAAQQQQQAQQQHAAQQQLTAAAVAAAVNSQPEVALADLAYNQALMIQLLQQNAAVAMSQQQSDASSSKSSNNKATSPTSSCSSASIYAQATSPPNSAAELSGLSSAAAVDLEPPPMRPDPYPTTLYSCLVCACYNTNSLDELNQHLLLDRSRQLGSASGNSTSSVSASSAACSDIMVILNNNYICRLCNYKTNLKANFQLHSKTDKHLQKLNFINHIREGGARNEYKLKYQQHTAGGGNMVQLKCNCCDFYTNSIQKLSLHVQHMRHDTMRLIFQHLHHLLREREQHNHQHQLLLPDKNELLEKQQLSALSSGDNERHSESVDTAEQQQPLALQQFAGSSYRQQQQAASSSPTPLICQLCSFSAVTLLEMLQHVKSLRHLQVEQFVCLQRRSEGMDELSLEAVFKLFEPYDSASAADAIATTKLNCQDNSSQPLMQSYACSIAEERNDGVTDTESSPEQNAFLTASNSNTEYSKFPLLPPTLEADADSLTSNMPSSIPIVIYKCSNCDYFAQSKQEIELHLSTLHPHAEHDYIKIPTNPAAIQAFQTAIAAATVAAAAAATCCISSKKSAASLQDDDYYPIAIKKERLDIPETEEDEEERPQLHTKNEQEQQPMEKIFTVAAARRSSADDDHDTAEVQQLQQQHMDATINRHDVQCPLCQDNFNEKHILELHLMRMHSVSRHGLARLLQLVDNSLWQQMPTATATSEDAYSSESATATLDFNSNARDATAAHTTAGQQHSSSSSSCYEMLSCQQCEAHFKHEQQLLQHAQKTQHYALAANGDYLCLATAVHKSSSSSSSFRICQLQFASLPAMLAHYKDAHMSLIISERHVYKYRCKQCSLAFKTQEKLSAHSLYHTMREATKCALCQRSFRSTQALEKHMEQTHGQQQSPQTDCIDAAECGDSPLAGGDSSGNEAERFTTEANDNKTTSTRAAVAISPKHPMELSELKTDLNNAPAARIPPRPKQSASANTTALLKQEEQYSTDVADPTALQKLQMEPTLLSHKYMLDQQQQNAQNSQFTALLPQSLQSIQSLQSLQQMQQQLPQLAAAAAASSIPLNPVDMLNLMQFHHLMSLNFMNLAPPLIFGGTSVHGNAGSTATAAVSTAANATSTAEMLTTCSAAAAPVINVCSTSQQPQQTSPVVSSVTQLSNNQKRARTRITDDQLKILRAHFDINNSPSEESIMEMSQKANLPMKVVKHWFRNTLFKERQRNKDSPYNFNNPPSTTLNLEEYERTGHAKAMPLAEVPSTDVSSAASSTQQNADNNSTSLTPICNESMLATRSSADAGITLDNSFSGYQQQQQQQLQQQTLKAVDIEVSNALYPMDVQIKSEFRANDNIDSSKQQQQQQQLLSAVAATPSMLLQQHQQRLAAAIADVAVDLELQQQLQAAQLQQHHQQQQQQQLAAALQQQHSQQQQQHATFAGSYNSYETKSESGSSDNVLSRPQTPNSTSGSINNPYSTSATAAATSNMNELLSQQLEELPLCKMGPPKKCQLTGMMVSSSSGSAAAVCTSSLTAACSKSNVFDKHSLASATASVTAAAVAAPATSASQYHDNNSNSSSNSSSTSASGKRANRTRFTDYQIKVLQEFFENNSYPKDSDLEYLSKLLLLSPRVIVVWFQNARQKQRKIYENQPNNTLYETEEKKQNINYACKKCNLVFQRYYELIRHQKNHCFKEENNKKSAKAQIAAAQIAQNLSSEDSNSSLDINSGNAAAAQFQHQKHVAAAAAAAVLACSGTAVGSGGKMDFSPSTTPPSVMQQQQRERSNSLDQQQLLPAQKQMQYDCEKCKLNFPSYEHLREHQLLHLMNPNRFVMLPQQHGQADNRGCDEPANQYGPFSSILQNLQHAAVHQQQHMNNAMQQMPLSKKRKFSETSSNTDAQSPNQLMAVESAALPAAAADYERNADASSYEFLYQYFMQNESNVELRQQFRALKQQQSTASDSGTDNPTAASMEMEIEFLGNYYQQAEFKKRNSYDFLYQYYLKNEQQEHALCNVAEHAAAINKPQLDFLLQYYQLTESKKFFQLEASPQAMRHCKQKNDIDYNEDEHDDDEDDADDDEHMPLNFVSTTTTTERDYHNNNHNGSDSGSGKQHRYQQHSNHMLEKCAASEKDVDANEHAVDTTAATWQANNASHNSNNGNTNKPISSNKVNQRRQQRFKAELGCEQSTDMDDMYQQQKQRTMHNSTATAEHVIGKQPKTTTPPPTATIGSYYHNLEDFLDASMIENQTKTLNFVKDSDNDSLLTTTATKATLKKRSPSVTSPPTVTSTDQTATAATSTSSKCSTFIAEQKQQNKRLRTTILPEQLNFLYECYQTESNPSRKMLEDIAKKVNLKKRVVQVWFQNSRAKDKKSRNQLFNVAKRAATTSSATTFLIGSCSSNNEATNSSNSNSSCYSYGNNSNSHSKLSAKIASEAAIVANCSGADLIDCQLTQVNIQQHSLTMEHMRQVKELQTQTTPTAATAAAETINNSQQSAFAVLERSNTDDEQQHQPAAIKEMACEFQQLATKNGFCAPTFEHLLADNSNRNDSDSSEQQWPTAKSEALAKMLKVEHANNNDCARSNRQSNIAKVENRSKTTTTVLNDNYENRFVTLIQTMLHASNSKITNQLCTMSSTSNNENNRNSIASTARCKKKSLNDIVVRDKTDNENNVEDFYDVAAASDDDDGNCKAVDNADDISKAVAVDIDQQQQRDIAIKPTTTKRRHTGAIAATVPTSTITSDIIQQLFNCKQITVDAHA